MAHVDSRSINCRGTRADRRGRAGRAGPVRRLVAVRRRASSRRAAPGHRPHAARAHHQPAHGRDPPAPGDQRPVPRGRHAAAPDGQQPVGDHSGRPGGRPVRNVGDQRRASRRLPRGKSGADGELPADRAGTDAAGGRQGHGRRHQVRMGVYSPRAGPGRRHQRRPGARRRGHADRAVSVRGGGRRRPQPGPWPGRADRRGARRPGPGGEHLVPCRLVPVPGAPPRCPDLERDARARCRRSGSAR